MTWRKRISLILAPLLVIGLLIYLASEPEPTCQGKPLSLWVQHLRSVDPSAREEARTALRSIAHKAVPHLIKTLEKKDSRLKQAINRLSKASWLRRNLFRSVRQQDRIDAAYALGEIGPPALAAVPALTRVASDGSFYFAPEVALIKIRPDSIIDVFRAFSDTTSNHWDHTVILIGELGEDAKPAIPAVLKALQDTNSTVSQQAPLAEFTSSLSCVFQPCSKHSTIPIRAFALRPFKLCSRLVPRARNSFRP